MTDEQIDRSDELLEMYAEDQRHDATRNGSLLGDMFNGTWLDAQTFPPLEYAVPGIIPEGFGVLAAPPKTGKSWLVCGLGLACAAGGTALGTITVPKRPVLYMALEDGKRRLQSRCRRIMANQPIPAGLNFITHAENSHITFGMLFEFLQHHHDDKPLVILDTLGRAKPTRPPSADPYQFDYKVGSQLKTAVDAVPGATLLVVHHTRKAESSDFIDAVSGTQGIAGSADFVLVLMRKRHSDEAFLSVTGRDVSEAEYALTVHEGLWQLDGASLSESALAAEMRREQQRLGDRALEVLAIVNQRAQTRGSDLAQIGIGKDQARIYLNRLAESGRIKKISRGVYKPIAPRSQCVTPVTNVTSEPENVTEVTNVTALFNAPSGPGRCPECGFHITTQGHRDNCSKGNQP
jgi:RecA-family ATPase